MSSKSDRRGSEAAAPILAFAIVALAGAVRILWWYWPGSIFDGTTSHIWTALAWNLAHGEFYRRPLAATGYGGTRYMPVLFVAHAMLIRTGADPIRAGVALMQGSVVAAAFALYGALRASNVPRSLAVPLAPTVFGTVIYQQYCTDLNPDYLAAALAMWAFVVANRIERRGRASTSIAAAVVAIAILTKLTAVVYVIPIAWSFVAQGDRKSAARFVVTTVALLGAAIAVVQIASAGAFAVGLAATLSGGMQPADVWRAAPKFLEEIARDPFVGVPFVVAWSCALGRRSGTAQRAPTMFLATASIVTVVIFASPGTVGNHLVDLHMASMLVIGIAVAESTLSARVATAVFAAMTIALAAISIPIPAAPSVVATLRSRGRPSRAAVEALHAEFLSAGTRYLSTDPVVPVLNDERPILIDAFNLDRFVREQSPAGRDVERRLRAHEFDVVVMRDETDPQTPRNSLERLVDETYAVAAVRPPFVVSTPRLHP